MRRDFREQTGERQLQLPQTLARDAARVPIDTVIGAIDNSQQQLNEGSNRRATAQFNVIRFRCYENGGGGDEELVLESERIVGGLDDSAEGVEEAEKKRRRRRRIVEGVVLEESEDVEFEMEESVFTEQGGEAEVGHRSAAGPAVETGGAAEVVVVD